MRKKKILFMSNHTRAYTGFGKNLKNLMKYLASTNKYELVEYASGMNWDSPQLNKMPWKAFGALPNDPSVLNQLNKNQAQARLASYGAYNLDRIIRQEKPDIFVGVEDFWGLEFAIDKPWWNKESCVVHTTLDSLPLFPSAVKKAPQIGHFYVWADFATREMHRLGHNHVKTIHGIIDTEDFYKLPAEQVESSRKRFEIPKNAFVIGFVFRNQLRKSVPNLLKAFKEYSADNPNAYLLLHTNWAEKSGWDIPRLIKDYRVDAKKVLTTYICSNCRDYEVKPFVGQKRDCPYCGEKKTQNTSSVAVGVYESQLNEIYNLMDVYCHPFTSGGQELPVQEAKLAELITLVTNYSCGEEYCTKESGGLPLDWSPYWEPGSNFMKASTLTSSIVQQLKAVEKMGVAQKRKMGKAARKFTLDNCGIESVGKIWEKIFDSMPFRNEEDFNFEEKKEASFADHFSPEDEGRRIGIVMPESAGDVFMTTSLLPAIASQYPNHNIYFITKPAFFPILDGNPWVHKVLLYASECDSLLFLEGHGDHKGFFEVCYLPHVITQRHLTWLHNGKDKIQFDLNNASN